MRVDDAERRQGVGVADGDEIAEPRQFAQQAHRLIAEAIQIGRGAKQDFVAGRGRVAIERDRLGAERVFGRGRRGRGGQPREIGGEGGDARRVGLDAVAGGAHQIGERVGGAQQDARRLGRRGERAGAHQVERRLEDMGEVDQRLKLEGAGAALDRMHGAEHRIDRLVVGLAFGHRGEAGLQLGELLLAFLKEGVADRRQGIVERGHASFSRRLRPRRDARRRRACRRRRA